MWRYDVCEILLNGKTLYVVMSEMTNNKHIDDYVFFNFEKFSAVVGRFFLGERIFQKIVSAFNENKLINEESDKELYEFLENTKADFYDYLAYSDGNRSSDKEVI